jgi:Protein of unknown function (DUF2752)
MLRDQTGSTAAAASDTESAPVARLPASWDEPEWPADDDAIRRENSSAGRHREVLAVAAIALVLSFAMVEVPGGRVAVRGLTAYPLPQSCVTRALLGIKCPGCGLTRSFIHLAEGDWAMSWRCHRLGGLFASVLIFQFPYRLLALRRPERPPIPTRWQGRLGAALIFLLIANWLADVVTGRVASL